MEITETRVETQGDLVWNADSIPTAIMHITVGAYQIHTTPEEAIRIFGGVVTHAQQMQADVSMVEAMLKSGLSVEHVQTITKLAMLKRMAGNG